MARAGFLLWVALLAFGLPEVFAGTGAGWLTRPDVYILAIPLYALHFLLLCHLALKARRTSWPALFLLGIVFGLYETWITKVVWSGYPDSDGFAMGSFGPWFGIHETVGLILFYHAITSFLLPLAVLTRLFPAYAARFPAPDWIFGATRWALLRRIGLALIWGLISGHNMPDPRLYLVSWLPMLALLAFGYWRLKHTLAARPILSRFGLWAGGIWLAILYIASWPALRTEAIPPAPALGITLGLYIVVALLFWWQKKHEPASQSLLPAPARMPFFWLLIVFFIGLATSVGISAGVGLAAGLAVLPFLAMVAIGAGLFFWLVVWRGLIRRC
ncbi:MAG: hypothetical protein COB08_019125 [Rhodobacteraceae bacterium]|nr:hypothetical protein [Paracoccaceae bacterium]